MRNHVTAYTEIARKMTLPIRQDSLFKIIPAAQMAADESGEPIYVIFSPFYVEERVESQHVYATQAASLLLYKKREGIDWNIDAVVDPSGSVYFTRHEDLFLVMANSHKEAK